MDLEECDMYEKKKEKKIDDKNICTHFIGDKTNKEHFHRCRYHCSYYDSLDLMRNGDSLFKRHGAFTQKRGR